MTTEQIGQENRVFGPPGTGKTTSGSKTITRAAEVYGPEKVIACSFTRAAAHELVSRDLPLPRQNIGTIHSLCYRSLDNPKIAEEHINEYNLGVPVYLQLSGGKVDLEDRETHGVTDADRDFSQIQILRNRMKNQIEFWPSSCQMLWAAWQKFKKGHGFLDYTDLLEIGLRDIRTLPGDPNVLVVDEGQDLTPLQLALVRQWARYVERFIIYADDDQGIYSFIGCTPDGCLKPDIPQENKQYLKQSFRVPRRVHAFAIDHISRVAQRESKEYYPRDAEGEVRRLKEGSHADPQPLLDDVERTIDGGQTAMILAPCSYQLFGIRAELMRRGIPFHNPYRRKRGDWNPLTPGKGTSTCERVFAFLRPRRDVWGPDAAPWRGRDLALWAELIATTDVLVRGSKKTLELLPQDQTVSLRRLDELFQPAALEELIRVMRAETFGPALDWLEKRLIKAKVGPVAFPATVLRKRGPDAVAAEPKVILGTIHSVKGGQADAVYLIPDLSFQAFQRSSTLAGADEIRRQFYVGMTRAKESLIFARPATGMIADLNWRGIPL